jgi:thiamine biosynthesis lipoprotein
MVKKVILVSGLWSLVSGLLFFSGCHRHTEKNNYSVAGTFLEVTSPDKRAGKIVYAECKRLEKIFDFYDPGSELSRLNASFNQPVKVSPEMIGLLRLSRQVYESSGGALDPTQGTLFELWKRRIKDKSLGLPSPEEVKQAKSCGGFDQVIIDQAASSVTLKKKGLKIDLGSITHGYMVDKAVQKLKAAGIHSALINLGGAVYCLGTHDGQPWRVGIKDPEGLGAVLAGQELRDEALSTSGSYEQYFERAGRRYAHIIDPHTGFPVDSPLVSVSVISANATTSDGLDTAFFVMGLDGIKRFIASRPSTLRIFVLVEENGKKRIHVLK